MACIASSFPGSVAALKATKVTVRARASPVFFPRGFAGTQTRSREKFTRARSRGIATRARARRARNGKIMRIER
jgi:hypothetical protein